MYRIVETRMLSKNLLVWNSTAFILMLGSLVISRVIASISPLKTKESSQETAHTNYKQTLGILISVHAMIEVCTCKMSGELVELVLVDSVNLLTIGVHVAASLEKWGSLVEDRVGQAANAKHVVGRIQFLIQDIFGGLIVQIPLTVRVKFVVEIPVFSWRGSAPVPRKKSTESKSTSTK